MKKRNHSVKPFNPQETESLLNTLGMNQPLLFCFNRRQFDDGSRIEVWHNHLVVYCHNAIYSLTFEINLFGIHQNWYTGVFITYTGDYPL